MPARSQTQGTILCIISVLFFSSYAVLAKMVVVNISPILFIAIAEVFSTISVLFFFGLLPEFKKVFTLPKKDICMLALLSLVSSVIAPLIFYSGLRTATATDASILVSLESVFGGIISFVWLKEAMTKEQAAGVIFMFAGVTIISTQNFTQQLTSNYGIVLLIIGCFFYGFGTNIFKKYLTHLPPEIVVLGRNGIGAIIILTILPFLFGIQHDFESIMSWEVLVPLFLFAFLTRFCAQFFWHKSMETIPATLASSILLALPIFSIVLVFLFLREPLYLYHLSGGMLVLGGLILTVFHQQKHPEHTLHQKVKRGTY